MMEGRLTKRDWLWAGVFLVAGIALRVPWRSVYAYHWDSAQFALAVEHYDLHQALPHMPGFPLYIGLGRAVNWFVGDPHASLVWISVVAGSVLAALGYLLATQLFGRRCGWLTGVILATSVLTWFHSEIALTTIVDGALVTGTALACWRALRVGGWGNAITPAVMLALVAGVRGQTVPGLLPLWFYTYWRMPARSWRKLLAAGIVVAAVSALWLAPMGNSAGGGRAYLELLAAKQHGDARYHWWVRGWPVLVDSVLVAAGSALLGLLLPGALALAEAVRAASRRSRETLAPAAPREAWLFLALWVGPLMFMGLFVMYTFLAGHILSYFPALAIASAYGVVKACERLRLRLAWMLVSVAVTNALLFLAGNRLGPSERLDLTAGEIRRHDQGLAAWFSTIRQRYRPEEVAVCHYDQWFQWGIRHFQYHLPEYENWLLTPDWQLLPPRNRQRWRVRDRQVEFVSGTALPAAKWLVLVVPPGGSVQLFATDLPAVEARRVEVPGGVPLYELDLARAVQ